MITFVLFKNNDRIWYEKGLNVGQDQVLQEADWGGRRNCCSQPGQVQDCSGKSFLRLNYWFKCLDTIR